MKNFDYRAPAWLKWALDCLAGGDMSSSIEDDLRHRFASISAARGPRRARLALFGHALFLLVSLSGEALTWRFAMLRNYFKSARRQIVRRKGAAFINILGLTVGIAGFILIGLWVRDELSFDRFHENKDRIFRILNRVESGRHIASPTYALSPALAELYPEVEESVRVYPHFSSLVKYGDKRFAEYNFLLTDPGFFRMFSFPFFLGNPKTALEARNAVVLTRSMAVKYFGEDDPLGKTLHIASAGADFIVTGVIEDPPVNSHIRFDIAVRVELLGEDRISRWSEWVGPCYVMLRPGVDAGEFESKISGIYKEYVNPEVTFYPVLQSLKRVHLYGEESPVQVRKVAVFAIIAVFILLMACINFMNLATARSVQRAREVGMRKVIGARRAQVARQFLGEALSISLIALVLAVILVEAILPWFNGFTGKDMSLLSGAGPGILLILLLTAGLTGLVAGSYPAFFLSSFQPVNTLRRREPGEGGASNLRKGLIVFQFAISVGLIVCTLVVAGQLRFIENMDLGLNRENVVGFYNTPELIARFDEFRNDLLDAPGILAVTSGAQPPTQVGQSINIDWEGNTEDNELNVDYSVVDYDFFKTFEMQIVQGRAFSRRFPTDIQDGCIISETVARRIGVEDPVGLVISMLHPGWTEELRRVRVIGVVRDFHSRSAHTEIRPFVFRMYQPWHFYGFVKLDGTRIPGALERIEAAFKKYAPEYPFQYMFYDEFYNQQYAPERQLGSLFSGFSLLSVLISCLGLLGLASFTAERKTKEIGIRKVMGASIFSIVGLTAREFLKWVALACLFAWPLSYWLMHKWLEDYASKIALGPGAFLLAGLLALGIALLTVGFHSIRAALADPVDSLRYE